jgi:type IV pilus assembly protein PilQ
MGTRQSMNLYGGNMNSLLKICGYGKKAVIAIMIVSSLALGVAAQKVEPQQQGRMYGDPGFRGEPINLKIVNMDIRDVLAYITEQYGINFVIDRSVTGVPVTVNLNDIPWNVALDSILAAQELGVQVNGSILRIASAKTLADELEIKRKNDEGRLDSSPLYTEFIRLNYARAGAATGGGTEGFTGGQAAGASAGGAGGDSGILGIIRRRLSRRGAVEVHGTSNTIIITDVRQNIDAIRQLVTLLDQPEPQVEVEARIVIAQRNFLRDIGLQIGFRGNPFTDTTGGSIIGQTGRGTDNVPTGLIQLTTGIFGTAQITAALNLAETKGQSKTIASPRVTAMNNMQAQIESGSQIPVTTVQRGAGGDDDGAVVFTTTFVQVPLRLSVTPRITDAGTVIMHIVAENNTVNPALAAGLGGTPGIDMQRMQTDVLVPDGGTTVIGGVLTDLEVGSKSKVPGLGDIPIVKYLFRTKTTQRNTSEILFFITPRIYRPDYEGNPTSGKIGTGNRSTTILQPVPLGNPASNSEPTPAPTPVPVIPVPVPVPAASPASNNRP